MNAIATNVLLYSVDRSEPAKQLKAQELLQQVRSASEPTFLLWQVLGEVGQQLRRWRDQAKLTAVEFGQHAQAFRHLVPDLLPRLRRDQAASAWRSLADDPVTRAPALLQEHLGLA